MKGSKRGSPVRIFTNVNPADVVLPSAEGYRYAAFTGECSTFPFNRSLEIDIQSNLSGCLL